MTGSANSGDVAVDSPLPHDAAELHVVPSARKCHADVVSFAFSGRYDKHRPVLIDALDPSRSISRARAHSLVNRLAGAFAPDSAVCLHLPNDVTYPILTLSIFASRCRWTGANPSYTRFELEHLFRTAQVNYVVTRAESLETVRAAVDASGTGAEIIIYSDILSRDRTSMIGRKLGVRRDSAHSTMGSAPDSSLRSLHDLMQTKKASSLAVALQRIDVNSIAALMTTSGTTGLPKMAARTHAALVHEALSNEDNHAAKPYQVRRLISTPIFHAFTTPELIINALRLGHPTYILPRFDRVRFPALLATYGITETFAPPPMLQALLNLSPMEHEKLQSLRAVYTGGAPLSAALETAFRALFDTLPQDQQLRIVQVWGMTEGGWFTSWKYPAEAANSMPTGGPALDTAGGTNVGQALPGLEIRIAPDSAATAAFSPADSTHLMPCAIHVGEVLIRGPQIMKEYLKNPAATKSAFTADGWLRTGDIGYLLPSPAGVKGIHSKPSLVLVDRAKDLIKVNGFQVAPAEIENALLNHPDVADVGVVGVPNTDELTTPDCARSVHSLHSQCSSATSSGLLTTTASASEHPIAFVVLKPATGAAAAAQALSASAETATGELLRAWLLRRLSRYKVATCEIRFVAEIPKSGAGKILRNELKQLAAVGACA